MDLKYALRSLRKNPGFTALAVIVMALGIGANTAVFSVVDAVLLRPLPYRNPERIVTIQNYWRKEAAIGRYVSAPDFHDWHDQASGFQAMAYYQRTGAQGATTVVIGDSAEYANGASVTAEFFDVFAVRPALGRMFSADEVKPGSGGAALISDAYWRARFGGNLDVLGSVVRLYDKPLTIVGVMPAGFDFPNRTQIWFPANTIFKEQQDRGSHNYFAIARLKAGVTMEQARAQMSSIATALEQRYPNSNEGKGASVERVLDSMVTNVRLTLYVLLGSVGVVLLIACANIANLLLAKSTARAREIAIRAAVGASRARIVRQLVIESVVLAAFAGTAGLVLAVWGVGALVHAAPANVPRLSETGIDGWVLAFTFAISVGSSLLFGLAPALQASKMDLNESLKQAASKRVTGGRAGRIRSALVVAEVALSVVLLTGAGELIRSFEALSRADVGYRTEGILVAKTAVPASDDKGIQRALEFANDLVPALRALPGVTSVGMAAAPPGSVRSSGAYWIDALPPPAQRSITAPQAVFSVVGPGLFEPAGIPLKAGRDFEDGDHARAPRVVVINEALARKSFPGQNPIGRKIFCGFDSMEAMTIVGIAGDVRQYGPESAPGPELFMPYRQHPGLTTDASFLIRTSADPSTVAEAVRRTIRGQSTEVPVTFTTMQRNFEESVAAPRFRKLLLTIFAALALSLAMAGVYGVMAYVVGQRSSEFGVRMALGASSADVLRLVIGNGLRLTGTGLAIGLAASIAMSRFLESLLFQVSATDPLTYGVVAGLLGTVALAACYLPARRATKVDPLMALRQE